MKNYKPFNDCTYVRNLIIVKIIFIKTETFH